MKAREVVTALESRGATFLRQKGSHARYRSECGKCVTTVPMTKGDIKRGTLHGIESDMELCYGKGWLTS